MEVSVVMITYNHENFIRQAIEGVLAQNVDFDFELIVANDLSPDDTHAIITTIIMTHPKGSLIRYYKNERNLGMYENVMGAFTKCKGKYVALCEGDDYWTDPLKLQKQVDFLAANPDYEVCFTNIRIVDENDKLIMPALITDNRKTEYEKKDLPIWAPLLTRVFRNRDFSSVPSAPGLDTVMLLWQSQYGRIKFINEITGTYRKHAGGIYSAQTEGKRKEQIILTDIVSLRLIDASLYSKYFGMLFKKLVELRFIDTPLFKINKSLIHQAFKDYKNKMAWSLILKIRLSFLLVSLPIPNQFKSGRDFLLKVLNRLFIY